MIHFRALPRSGSLSIKRGSCGEEKRRCCRIPVLCLLYESLFFFFRFMILPSMIYMDTEETVRRGGKKRRGGSWIAELRGSMDRFLFVGRQRSYAWGKT